MQTPARKVPLPQPPKPCFNARTPTWRAERSEKIFDFRATSFVEGDLDGEPNLILVRAKLGKNSEIWCLPSKKNCERKTKLLPGYGKTSPKAQQFKKKHRFLDALFFSNPAMSYLTGPLPVKYFRR